jgi:hypothetical protein
LSTSTVAFYDVFNVFEDTVYHTFVFVSATGGAGTPAPSANITGVVKNASGRVMPAVPIIATFANGHKLYLRSDASGTYRIFLVPPGSVTVTAEGTTETFAYVAGQKLVKPLVIGSAPK